MTLTVFFAVLAAAAMHAIWNAMVKVHLDRFGALQRSVFLVVKNTSTSGGGYPSRQGGTQGDFHPNVIARKQGAAGDNWKLLGTGEHGDLGVAPP